MTEHVVETQLARELCSKAIPCEGCLAAARLVLVNQAAVLRLLKRLEPPKPPANPHVLHMPHLPRVGWETP